MSMYYDPDGKPIEQDEWIKLFEDHGPHRMVEKTELPNGLTVSTVWMGLDHDWSGNGPTLIYETMVFADGWEEAGDTWRYSTREEALAGHAKMVETVSKEPVR